MCCFSLGSLCKREGLGRPVFATCEPLQTNMKLSWSYSHGGVHHKLAAALPSLAAIPAARAKLGGLDAKWYSSWCCPCHSLVLPLLGVAKLQGKYTQWQKLSFHVNPFRAWRNRLNRYRYRYRSRLIFVSYIYIYIHIYIYIVACTTRDNIKEIKSTKDKQDRVLSSMESKHQMPVLHQDCGGVHVCKEKVRGACYASGLAAAITGCSLAIDSALKHRSHTRKQVQVVIVAYFGALLLK